MAARQERIRDLMVLALGTSAGRCLANRDETLKLVRQEARPEALLERFPVVSRETYLSGRDGHLNPDSREPGFRLFEYPLPPLPRTAIFMEGFVETEKVMCFPDGWCADLERFHAECLAGPVAMLRRMATTVLNRGAHFGLKRPIIAFTGLPFGDTGVLTDADRDQLWHAFSVPVYEHFLGHRHEVLARECTEQSGLHIDPAQAVFEVIEPKQSELAVSSMANTTFPVLRLASGLSGSITDAPCACGIAGERILHLRALSRIVMEPRVRSAMAGATVSGGSVGSVGEAEPQQSA